MYQHELESNDESEAASRTSTPRSGAAPTHRPHPAALFAAQQQQQQQQQQPIQPTVSISRTSPSPTEEEQEQQSTSAASSSVPIRGSSLSEPRHEQQLQQQQRTTEPSSPPAVAAAASVNNNNDINKQQQQQPPAVVGTELGLQQPASTLHLAPLRAPSTGAVSAVSSSGNSSMPRSSSVDDNNNNNEEQHQQQQHQDPNSNNNNENTNVASSTSTSVPPLQMNHIVGPTLKQQQQQQQNVSPTNNTSSASASTPIFSDGKDRKIRQLEQEKDELQQSHQDEIHRLNLELKTTKTSLEHTQESNCTMEKRMEAALESETLVTEENNKLREQLKNLTSRAKTTDGELARFEDIKNTHYVDHVKGRFEISVQFMEGLLNLLFHDKKLCQQESVCYSRAHERAEQLLTESESLREEMQNASVTSEEQHMRQINDATRTIEELQRENSYLRGRTSSTTMQLYPLRDNITSSSLRSGVASVDPNNNQQQQTQQQQQQNFAQSNFNSGNDLLLQQQQGGGQQQNVVVAGSLSNLLQHNQQQQQMQQNYSSRVGTPSPATMRGASSTMLRSATAPLDPEATSRRLQEELADALQSKESLNQNNRQLKQRIRELEQEMENLLLESRRVHELMKDDIKECRTMATKTTTEEIFRVKKEQEQLQQQLMKRVEHLEEALSERTQAAVFANQQVRHLTEVLEDACKAGAVPLLRTAPKQEGSNYPTFTVGNKNNKTKQQQKTPSYTWNLGNSKDNNNNTIDADMFDGSGLLASTPTPKKNLNNTTPYLATLEASGLFSPNSKNNTNETTVSSSNLKSYHQPRISSSVYNNILKNEEEQKPDWNNSKRSAMPFLTASQYATSQQPIVATSSSNSQSVSSSVNQQQQQPNQSHNHMMNQMFQQQQQQFNPNNNINSSTSTTARGISSSVISATSTTNNNGNINNNINNTNNYLAGSFDNNVPYQYQAAGGNTMPKAWR